ncbi:MAG: BFD-like (2Fe-2S) protein [Deltaproteobacteria bacterium]|nr:MAG: BFD-like (2Fe-2S) protein [Deltaproteobacteria bacterium]
MDKKICYCFNHGEEEIRQDVLNNGGTSIILETILNAKRQSSCQCITKHPEGR